MRVLSSTGLPVLDVLGKKLGYTTKQLKDIMSTAGGGQKLFEEGGLTALIDGLGERYKGMMDEQSKTFMGKMSTLMDTFQMGAARVLKPFVDSILKPMIDRVTPFLEQKLGRLSRMSAKFGEGFQVGGLRGGLVALDQFFGSGPRLSKMFDKALPTLRSIWSTAKKVGAVSWSTFIGALKAVGQFLTDHKESIKTVVNKLASLAAKSWTKLLGAIKTISRFVTDHKQDIKDVVNKLVRLAGLGWGAITGAFNAMKSAVKFISKHDMWKSIAIGVGIAAGAMAAFAVATWLASAPIILIGLGIALLAIGVVHLVRKWHTMSGKVKSVFAAVALLLGPIAVAGLLVIALIGSWDSVKSAIGTAINFVRDLISTIAGIPRNIDINLRFPGSGTLSHLPVIGGAFKADKGKKNESWDTHSPRVRARGFAAHGTFSATLGMHHALGAGGIRIASGQRNHHLGSPNSAHRRGNALDLVGSGLPSYAQRLVSAGGYAAFHGSGESRHLHAEYPIGDNASPRISAGSSGHAGDTVTNNYTFNLTGSNLSAGDLEGAMHRFVNKRERDRREGGRHR